MATCRDLWDQGLLQLDLKGPAAPDAVKPDQPIPPLVACTLHNGVAAVFPGDAQTCVRLGLPQLTE